MQPNQEFVAKNADIPPLMLHFCADASVVNAAAQNVPPGFAAATSTTSTAGYTCGRNTSVISRCRVTFTGDAANVGGQTIQVAVFVNGVAIASAVLTTALATTAGAKSGTVDFTPTTLAEGDVVRVTLTPSALLTAVVTNPTVVLS